MTTDILKNLKQRLSYLEEKHDLLDKKIEIDFKHRLNNLAYSKEKKKKLNLKDKILALKQTINIMETDEV